MRISVTGTACQGKSTFIKDFIEYFPKYSTPEKTYRDMIKEKVIHIVKKLQRIPNGTS